LSTGPAARRIARFAAEAVPPDDVLEAARLHLLDTLGVALGAAALRHRPRVEYAARRLGFGHEATGIGQAKPLSTAGAALLNGMLAHAMEADDTHIGAVMHGSAVVLPAALAAAERADADGSMLLRAFVVGWEVLIRVGLAFPGELLHFGFQATSAAGPFGAAIAAGVIAGLDENGLTAALGIAGSQGGGVFEFLAEGSTSKWLHAGWPALAGLVAVDLASAGLTGPETVLDGPRGFGAAFARRSDGGEAALATALDDLGHGWRLPEVAVKLYPTCHFVQPFLECLEELLAGGMQPAQVAEVHCFVPPGAAALICEPEMQMRHPVTPYQAKWSLPYCLGAMLADGCVTPASFDRATPDFQALERAELVKWSLDPAADFPRCYPGRLTVHLHDGTRLEAAVTDVRGGKARLLLPKSILAKFHAYVAPALNEARADKVIAAVAALGRGGSARALGRELRDAAGGGPL
jgi:2-methylcitrate dehydratase PrpD